MATLNLSVIANNDELRYVGDGFGPTGTLQVAPPVWE